MGGEPLSLLLPLPLSRAGGLRDLLLLGPVPLSVLLPLPLDARLLFRHGAISASDNAAVTATSAAANAACTRMQLVHAM